MVGCLRTRVRKQPTIALNFESETVFQSGMRLYTGWFLCSSQLKETKSATMNIFRKKNYFLFKSFVKVEFSYVFTINLFTIAEICMEK